MPVYLDKLLFPSYLKRLAYPLIHVKAIVLSLSYLVRLAFHRHCACFGPAAALVRMAEARRGYAAAGRLTGPPQWSRLGIGVAITPK